MAEHALGDLRIDEAERICQRLLVERPGNPGALALLGVVAGHRGDAENAVDLIERALKQQPRVAPWYANLCVLYRSLRRVEDAVAAGERALNLAPDDVKNLINLSLALAELGNQERSDACLLRAIGLDPMNAEAHFALGEMLLARGEFAPGWLEYEWRNETEVGRGQLPALSSARWNGMHIANGRILLFADQGYGDTIQFARYIPRVAERCQEVVLACSPELAPLLAQMPGVSKCFQSWSEIPGHAAHARLSSLPGLFHTTLDTIPRQAPYLFADPRLTAKWGARLTELAPRPLRRVGLAWSGRPSHPNDRRRSIGLANLTPLAATDEVAFLSLQKPFPHIDVSAMDAFPGLTDISSELTDFAQTAALIANLDLVITVDTAMAHLTGALGRPVWILLPKPNDWRWLRERSDSPWYPSARLFRQKKSGVWEDVIADVADTLQMEFGNFSPTPMPNTGVN